MMRTATDGSDSDGNISWMIRFASIVLLLLIVGYGAAVVWLYAPWASPVQVSGAANGGEQTPPLLQALERIMLVMVPLLVAWIGALMTATMLRSSSRNGSAMAPASAADLQAAGLNEGPSVAGAVNTVASHMLHVNKVAGLVLGGSAPSDVPLSAVVDLLTDQQVSRMPVFQEHGRTTHVVSSRYLYEYIIVQARNGNLLFPTMNGSAEGHEETVDDVDDSTTNDDGWGGNAQPSFGAPPLEDVTDFAVNGRRALHAHSLQDLLDFESNEQRCSCIAYVGPSATLREAEEAAREAELVRGMPCRDVVVTRNGDADGPAVGWMTREVLLGALVEDQWRHRMPQS